MSRLASRTAAGSAALALLLALSFAPAAHAQSTTTTHEPDRSFGFRGIGVRAGLVDPEGASSTITYGAHVDLGEFVPNLRITPFAEYWSVGVNNADRSDFLLATNVDWKFPLVGPKVTPYAGAGLGLHFLKANYPAPLADDSKTRFGLHVQGGLVDEVMPNFDIFGELRFTFVDQADNFKLLGGFTYNFIY